MNPKCPKCNIDLKLCSGNYPYTEDHYICPNCDGTHDLYEFDTILVNPKWRDYELSWCNQCDSVVITCPHCHNTSCNGGGCIECNNDFNDFNKLNISIFDFLNEEEVQTYNKIKKLKNHLINILKDN